MSYRDDLIQRGRSLIEEVSDILARITDQEAGALLGSGPIDSLLRGLLDPTQVLSHSSVQEYLSANRVRAQLIARIQYVIVNNYSFLIPTEDGDELFVSPMTEQWFDDGVMYLLGQERFAGFICLFRNGAASYGIAARDVRPGEPMGPEHFEFISAEEANRLQKELNHARSAPLDEPMKALRALITAQDNDESKYQELLHQYPWAFGAQYTSIQRHTKLDDQNIPDFTGSRVHDHCRDIIEIKPPFATLFKANGAFSAAFNQYWDQAERYLDFARTHKDYLLSAKGLRFGTPTCYLVLGFNLGEEQLAEIRRKERMNPAIRILTYNDLLTYMGSTVSFIRSLKDRDTPSGPIP